MPANTPKLALPYPLGTDLLADGDNAIQNLALALEALLNGDTNPYPVATWLALSYDSSTTVAGNIYYTRRAGWVAVELAIAVGAGGAAGGAPLSLPIPVGYRPSRQILRQVQGAGVLRGVSMNTDGIIRVDFGGTANAGFYGGFIYPT